jgi:hypothetical protein
VVDRNNEGRSETLTVAADFHVDEDLRKAIKECLGIEDLAILERAVNDVETVIRAYRIQGLMPPMREERDRFSRVHRAANELLAGLGGLSFRSYFYLFRETEAHGGLIPLDELIRMLRDLERAVSQCKQLYRVDPKRERREEEKDLAAMLVKIFHACYSLDRPRRGRKSTFRRDTIRFVVVCFEAAGVTQIPDEESLYRRYIMPSRRWLEASPLASIGAGTSNPGPPD